MTDAPQQGAVFGLRGDTSMGTPLNLEANLDAAMGLATGVVNPAEASSGLSQDMAALNLGVPQTSAALHFCPVPGCISAASGRRPGSRGPLSFEAQTAHGEFESCDRQSSHKGK